MVEIIKEIQVKNVMTKSKLPVGGYSVNPYVGWAALMGANIVMRLL